MSTFLINHFPRIHKYADYFLIVKVFAAKENKRSKSGKNNVVKPKF